MEGSLTGPVFLNAAEELMKRIQGDEDPKAALLANEARKLIVVFRSWAKAKPEPNERADAVNALIELNRKVLIHISKKTRV